MILAFVIQLKGLIANRKSVGISECNFGNWTVGVRCQGQVASCLDVSDFVGFLGEEEDSADVVGVHVTVYNVGDGDVSDISDCPEHAMADCWRAINHNHPFRRYKKEG